MTPSHRRSLRGFLALATALQLLTVGFVCTTAQTRRKPRIVYYSVPANQTMHVRLNQELDSETARVGDTFTSTLIDPVLLEGQPCWRLRKYRQRRCDQCSAGKEER